VAEEADVHRRLAEGAWTAAALAASTATASGAAPALPPGPVPVLACPRAAACLGQHIRLLERAEPLCLLSRPRDEHAAATRATTHLLATAMSAVGSSVGAAFDPPGSAPVSLTGTASYALLPCRGLLEAWTAEGYELGDAFDILQSETCTFVPACLDVHFVGRAGQPRCSLAGHGDDALRVANAFRAAVALTALPSSGRPAARGGPFAPSAAVTAALQRLRLEWSEADPTRWAFSF